MINIAVIMTGGTIASVTIDRVTKPHAGNRYEILNQYEKRYGKDVNFEVFTPFYKLSENIEPHDWIELKEVILKCQNYDGIVITHGTDTLPFTAAALSFLCLHMNVPILMTASNTPIGDCREEAIMNFRACIQWIKAGAPRGVYIVFGDSDGLIKVHLGTRLMASSYHNHRFTSYGEIPFGEIHEEVFIPYEHPSNLMPPICECVWENRLELPEVGFVSPYPGLIYENLLYYGQPSAFLHAMYHSGTACSEGERTLLRFLLQCKERNIPLYGSPINDNASRYYQSTVKLVENGLIPMGNVSPITAWVKTKIFIENLHEKDCFHMKNYFYEKIPQ